MNEKIAEGGEPDVPTHHRQASRRWVEPDGVHEEHLFDMETGRPVSEQAESDETHDQSVSGASGHDQGQ